MTELEARRELLADPRRISPELRAAIEADPRLGALREELLAADAAMQRALTSAPVPDGLADRIVLRARYGSRSRWGLAIAATVAALAVGIPSYVRMHGRSLELARDRAIIDHVVQSVDELKDDGRVEPAALRASAAQLGISLRDPAGYRIRHLANCVIAGIESRHFIIEGPRGIVSYVILPGARGDDSERMLHEGGTSGLFARRGDLTVAVLAQNGMGREELESMMRAVLA
ncbi:MAG TPA: DUF3379 family protein [Usitatibacter sp.]|nr:DUF3379 family protein [Usitatibacter sp.]